MGWLRYLLLIASAGSAGFLIYVEATERGPLPWYIYGWTAACILNFLYLLRVRPSGTGHKEVRLTRLVGLWLDAKEAELHGRAKSAQERDRDENSKNSSH